MRTRTLSAVVAGVVLGGTARAQTSLPVDSIVARARAALAACDSLVEDATFTSRLYERELHGDGTLKSEKIYQSRQYVRGNDSREILVAMWEDGKPVKPSKLADEQKKRDEERKRRHERRGKGEDDEGGSQEMMAPLLPRYSDDYQFPAAAADTVDGIPCWKITVEPLRADEKRVKGFIWVAQADSRPVAEEYDMAKRPGALKEFGIRLDHSPTLGACAFPRRFFLKGWGKALVFIKFNFEVEMLTDSLQVNVGVPDSLFALPGSK
ncbi:MAG TPA: hypothetical protein VNN55_11070 [bacterium]|nr:hypothetical protein [bacterium]